MIKQFDKPTCRAFQAEAQAALEALAQKHNVKLTYRGGKFTNASFEFKFEAVVTAADGAPAGTEAEAFKQLATLYGLQPTDLGRTFKLEGKDARIIGCRPRASKKPILAEVIATGQRYVLGTQYARLLLAA